MNKVVLLGRLCREVESEEVGKGKNSFTKVWNCIACQKSKDEADFINFTALGKTAEILEEYASKGDKILIEGHIDVYTSEDKKGNKTTYTSIIADRVELLGGKKVD